MCISFALGVWIGPCAQTLWARLLCVSRLDLLLHSVRCVIPVRVSGPMLSPQAGRPISEIRLLRFFTPDRCSPNVHIARDLNDHEQIPGTQTQLQLVIFIAKHNLQGPKTRPIRHRCCPTIPTGRHGTYMQSIPCPVPQAGHSCHQSSFLPSPRPRLPGKRHHGAPVLHPRRGHGPRDDRHDPVVHPARAADMDKLAHQVD